MLHLIVAYGVLTYLNDWWNFFELLIFIVSAVYVLLYFIGYNTYGTIGKIRVMYLLLFHFYDYYFMQIKIIIIAEVFMSGVRLLRVVFLMRGIPMLKRFQLHLIDDIYILYILIGR